MTLFGEERDLVHHELAMHVFKNNEVSRVVRFLSQLSWQPTGNHLVPDRET